MKRNLFLLIAIAVLMACKPESQVRVSKGENGEIAVYFKAAAKYLLMPMEDTGHEKRMEVRTEGEYFNAFVIRPTKDRIDYWVPLELTDLNKKDIELRFESMDGYDLFLNELKLSNSFEFDADEKFRPIYHFTPPYGWMNDPNGMVWHNGVFHLKYQYNPYGTKWQNMSWGHAVSADLVHWEHQPVAFFPDTLGAIFSGGSVLDLHNASGLQQGDETTILAYYTSAGSKGQVQSLGYSNDGGKTWKKYEGNPILTHYDNDPDFRDPKVFWHEDSKRFVMVIALSLQKVMEIYSSENGIDWKYESRFGDAQGAQDGIWECPDLFEMQVEGEPDKSRWVLICNLNPGGPSGGSAAQYFVGDFDGKVFTNETSPEIIKWMDWGKDHYATVTWSNVPDSDGRRLAIGWMSNWEYANYVPTKKFRSAMTVVRELKLINRNGNHILTSYPVEELNKLRGAHQHIDALVVENEYVIDDFLAENNGAYEIIMNLDVSQCDVAGFTLFNNRGESVDVSINRTSGKMFMDRNNSGLINFNDRFAAITYADIAQKPEYNIRLLVDKASIELFEGGGETVKTNIVFPSEPYNRIRFFSKGGISRVNDLNIYKLD